MRNRQKEEANSNNAINYIRNSLLFSNNRYQWIRLLIEKVLDDNLCNDDVDNLIDSLLPKRKIKRPQREQVRKNKQTLQPVFSDGNMDTEIAVKKIKSIDKISNIGLLDVKDPIDLKDGLNVFYGENGAGKSSVYLSLCKALGKNDKSIYSNIATENNESCCQITIVDSDENEHPLKWDSSDENKELKVMIFDSLISNYIVEHAQKNQFKMAHLKMEYFSFLHNLYQKIESKLNQELAIINTEYEDTGQVLAEKASSVFEENFGWDKKKIKKFDFTKKDEEDLVEFNRQIKILEKSNPGSVVRNIGNALEETESVLSVFGEPNEEENENSDIEYGWELFYNKEYFKGVNGQIDKYNKVKKAFERSGKNKISSLIPPDWIDSNTWKNFISRSVDFLNSLDDEEFKEYTTKTCAYCHQSLQTKEAKALIMTYQELHEEHKEKLEKEASKLKKMSELMDECIKTLEVIPTRNVKIEIEFKTIGEEEQINFDFENVKKIFQKYRTAINKAQRIRMDDVDIKTIESFWSIYSRLSDRFRNLIDRLDKSIAGKDSKIKKLKTKVELLQTKKSLYENKGYILKYLKLDRLKVFLDKKISGIAPLRQCTSKIESVFSGQATLEEFKKCLKKEYKYFDFSPPEMWSIAPSTRGGVNKRVYSIRDRRLAEIFSEGEKKLHALSDFFAQCQLDKYGGVFIFDDPVNSLDEGNIEVVAKRIMDLMVEGHQVIVFTHNLVFLNSIIDTQKDYCMLVERLNDQIIIEKNTKVGDKKELSNRFNEIKKRMKDFQLRENESISEYEIKNVYDLISGYLENYLAIVMLSDIIGRFRPNIRMDSLDKLKSLDKDSLDKMIGLYGQSSIKGSRHGMPTSASMGKPFYQQLAEHVNELEENFKLS